MLAPQNYSHKVMLCWTFTPSKRGRHTWLVQMSRTRERLVTNQNATGDITKALFPELIFEAHIVKREASKGRTFPTSWNSADGQKKGWVNTANQSASWIKKKFCTGFMVSLRKVSCVKVTSKWRPAIDSTNIKINRQDNSHIPRELARAAKLHLLHPGLDCHVINAASWKFATADSRPWTENAWKIWVTSHVCSSTGGKRRGFRNTLTAFGTIVARENSRRGFKLFENQWLSKPAASKPEIWGFHVQKQRQSQWHYV